MPLLVLLACARCAPAPQTHVGCNPPPPDTYSYVDLSSVDAGLAESDQPDGGYSVPRCAELCGPPGIDLHDCSLVPDAGLTCRYVHSATCR
jgi:hypothetical protein